MLLNYIKLSVRLMLRNPFSTFINVAGLSIGFAAFYILWPYSQQELKSDQFHKDYQEIARLSRIIEYDQNGAPVKLTLPFHNTGIAAKFVRDYPEIIDLTRIIPQESFEQKRHGFDKDVFVSIDLANSERQFFREQSLVFADSNFFQVFSFPLESGNPEQVLMQPNTVVISSSHAVKYFGSDNPINKVIYFNDSIPLTIKGVFKDLPRNTHIKADVIMTTAGITEPDITDWNKYWNGYCYIKVAKGTNFNGLENKINAEKERIYGKCPRCPEDLTTSVFIQPLETVPFTDLLGNTFNYKSRYLLIALYLLAFVIPILAWINYISLSIQMLQKRNSELSIRKAVGAGRKHFIMQFIIEATLLNAISFFIALTVVQLVKSPVEYLLNFYTLPWSELPSSTIGITALVFILGIVMTSTYPILITMKQSVLIMKKKWSHSNVSWINLIVTTQYSAAIVLIICIGCVYFQLNYIMSKPLGVDKDGVMVIDCPLQQKNDFATKLTYFTTKLITIANVEGVTVSKNVLGDFAGYGVPLQRNRNGIEFGLDINGGVDENFLKVYGIKLLHGRNFQSDAPADQRSILISEDATVKLGFASPAEALGARLVIPVYDRDNVEVIGVYKDYEFRPFLSSYYQGERGSFLSYKNFLMADMYPSKISVRVNYASFQSTLPKLEKLFKEVFPNDTFHWAFLNENVQKYYTTEKIARNQIGVFTIIAIGIACLGLLGLVSSKIVEKTKEIGIRKVLGAGLLQIVHILLNTTSKQILIAALISIPVAYILVTEYLEKFSERITLQWWHFVFPLVTLIFIMFSTIATAVWKAARSNPVDALKHE